MSIGLPHATTSYPTRTNQAPSRASSNPRVTSMLMTSGRSARQHSRRATRVPQAGANHGQPGSLLTTAGRRSRPGPARHSRVPKLTTKYRCLRRAFAPGWCQDWAWIVVGHQGAGIPSRRRRRRSRPGAGRPMSFSRRVLHMDALPLARFEASSPTRRDTRFRSSRPAADRARYV
jgi:hypothetical protein